ncbi:para-nitrobenzyl esterase [Chitinophaga skermanii]|uniref:Carboxylic ester hydrolase n=1 Tax=Chitinophaga skermanii TaxID=331697 RepID=A0A327R1Q0_9BACT|nr:carboxylesterase family protein [Chitinophaga skermanii]RAJ10561.1 para-nitrobenzyl esterase [Chitinophaga skermanii]
MKKIFTIICLLCSTVGNTFAQNPLIVKVAEGRLQGVQEKEVRIFKGIPYAAAPIGSLRWKEPQAAKPWKGIRDATHFGNRAMQRASYADMVFRSPRIDEDCLYLNVWTNAKRPTEKLPVLVYFHGGGLSSGDGSEWRYDGESMARRGIVVVTVNYRLGIFGFYAHPALTKQSTHTTSGNYGYLDQVAALLWVKKNIAAFGGDPSKVTIAGQSAGSISVSSLMASPLAKGLFRAAIGESGAVLASISPIPLQEAEQNGETFMKQVGIPSIETLQQMPAEQLMELATKASKRFSPTVDGYYMPQSPLAIYETGLQADIPLLAGWTSAEVSYHHATGKDQLTQASYKQLLTNLYGAQAEEVLQFYPANNDTEMLQSATDLASDRYIVHGTWKWMDLHAKTSGSVVYRYLFAKHFPEALDPRFITKEPLLGAPHSSDISYALGNLPNNTFYKWTPADFDVSGKMQSYFVNFIKTGNPNGAGLPNWPGLQASIPKVMVFDTETKTIGEPHLKRFVFMDRFFE